MSLSLQDPGADGAHGVWGGAEAVLGHVVLQQPQPGTVTPVIMSSNLFEPFKPVK